MRPIVATAYALLAFLFLIFAGPSGGQQPRPASVPPEWVTAWRQDLRFVADSLPPMHSNFFHSVSREHFRAALDSLEARVPALTHHEIVVELARIVALVGDGHTRLTLPFDSAAGFFTGHSETQPPKIPGLVFRHLPVRLYSFDDGLHVTSASPTFQNLLGAKVVRIGRLTVDDAVAAVTPTVHRDNPMQLRGLLPNWLVVPEILQARGVIEDLEQVPLEVEDTTGARRTVRLTPVPTGTAVEWVDARRPGTFPLYLRFPDRRHWFVELPDTGTVYARYREVLDDEDETVAEFAGRLSAYLREHAIERLVLDIRGNVGGNRFLSRPLIRTIVRADRLWQPGGLFVLMDRGTFSAAVMLAAELERETPAIFVGEPTGGKPNGYGDSRRVRLPRTGLTIRVSTLFWQLTDPRDGRDAITPHVSVSARFADYRENRDAMLDTVLAFVRGSSEPEGTWRGTLGVEHQRFSVEFTFTRTASTWTGVFSLPDAGVVRQPLEGVQVRDQEIRFPLNLAEQAGIVRLRPGERGMAGTLEVAGSFFPVVLWRAGSGSESSGGERPN